MAEEMIVENNVSVHMLRRKNGSTYVCLEDLFHYFHSLSERVRNPIGRKTFLYVCDILLDLITDPGPVEQP